LDVLTGANDVQGPYGHPVPPGRAGAGGRGSAVAAAVLVIGVAGLIAAAIGLTIRLLPRHFTSAQQQRITTWEVAGRWRDLSAGRIFPATIEYAPPKALSDIGSSVTLTARRVGIAPQAPCRSTGHLVVDQAAAVVLAGNGCEAVLRATYTDGTGTYVATVGVAPFPSPAQAGAAEEALGAKRLRMSGGRVPSVLALPFAGTLAASFDDSRRQFTRNIVVGPYLVMYTIGYTDGRPLVPVSADSYADAEMTSFGAGVAKSAADTLGAPPAAPHCPGPPGC
jgi:hypothetical protein